MKRTPEFLELVSDFILNKNSDISNLRETSIIAILRHFGYNKAAEKLFNATVAFYKSLKHPYSLKESINREVEHYLYEFSDKKDYFFKKENYDSITLYDRHLLLLLEKFMEKKEFKYNCPKPPKFKMYYKMGTLNGVLEIAYIAASIAYGYGILSLSEILPKKLYKTNIGKVIEYLNDGFSDNTIRINFEVMKEQALLKTKNKSYTLGEFRIIETFYKLFEEKDTGHLNMRLLLPFQSLNLDIMGIRDKHGDLYIRV